MVVVYRYHLVDPHADQFLPWMERFPKQLRVDKGKSSRVAKQFPDDHFDFVYIGAGAGFEQTLDDMTDWYRKVWAPGPRANPPPSTASPFRGVNNNLPCTNVLETQAERSLLVCTGALQTASPCSDGGCRGQVLQ